MCRCYLVIEESLNVVIRISGVVLVVRVALGTLCHLSAVFLQQDSESPALDKRQQHGDAPAGFKHYRLDPSFACALRMSILPASYHFTY